jgi:UDP-glucose 4-epimerase
MRGVDTVFHQAGLVSVDASVDEPRESQTINAGGTVEVLDCARRADARVVTASSAAVYGHPSTVPIPERARFDPTSPYGADKVTLDHYTRLFSDLYGLPTVALRYFNVYGPRQSASDYSGVISTFLDQAQRGTALTVHGDGTQTRDFVHVSDVVRANLLAATTEHTGEAFNVGTGTETQIRELARIVGDLVATEPGRRYTDGRSGDIERSCAETDRAETMLDFEARVGLREGIETLLPTDLQPRNRRI